jgi:hypothetical protein
VTAAVFVALLVVGAGPFVLVIGWIAMQEVAARRRSRAFRRRMDAYTNTERLPLGGKWLP